ncbi:MAG TPA: Uma2 family endonuclease [Leptolyngbya sp.]|jgi:Uma2 family endonuclease|nr:Uma2 family endonuclease [Leptolyngbya sp.]
MTDQQFYEFCRTNPALRSNGRIFGQLFIWSEANATGEAFDSSSGFTLPNGATRSPDAAWILSDRWNALSPEQQASFAPIVPDFVVELRSSSDTLVSLKEKMTEYIANGVRLGLLIDRKNRQVHVYRRDREPEILDYPESVNCEPEMPTFALKMAKIW